MREQMQAAQMNHEGNSDDDIIRGVTEVDTVNNQMLLHINQEQNPYDYSRAGNASNTVSQAQMLSTQDFNQINTEGQRLML